MDICLFAGQPCPWMIKKVSQICRLIWQQHPNFIMSPLESHQGSSIGIAVATKATFFPALYTNAMLDFPITLKVRAGGLAKSAFSVVKSLQCQKTGKPLYIEETVLVNADTRSHRAVPLQIDFLKKYEKGFNGRTVPRINSPIKPKQIPIVKDDGKCSASQTIFLQQSDHHGAHQVHHFQRQAVWSDLDHLDHVNQQNFVRFCLDAASLFTKQVNKPETNFTEGEMMLKHVQCVNKGEVLEGQIMDIFVWEARENFNVLYFQIEVNGKLVMNATLEFYPPSVNSNI